jgi:hypothetical protein
MRTACPHVNPSTPHPFPASLSPWDLPCSHVAMRASRAPQAVAACLQAEPSMVAMRPSLSWPQMQGWKVGSSNSTAAGGQQTHHGAVSCHHGRGKHSHGTAAAMQPIAYSLRAQARCTRVDDLNALLDYRVQAADVARRQISPMQNNADNWRRHAYACRMHSNRPHTNRIPQTHHHTHH